jgi:hypothetical protein
MHIHGLSNNEQGGAYATIIGLLTCNIRDLCGYVLLSQMMISYQPSNCMHILYQIVLWLIHLN